MQPDTHEAYINKVIDFLVRGMKEKMWQVGEILALGGIRGIAEITSWVNEKYGNQWKDFGTVMADMVPRSHGENASSLEPKHFRVLERVNRGKYRLLN